MDIGVIGLGHMGLAIASRLLACGHKVTVYNRTAQKADPLVAQGAILAHDAAGTAGGDIVVTILADDNAVSEIVFGAGKNNGDNNGLLAYQNPNCLHVSMSTISVALSSRIASAFVDAGKQFISAPVMGRPDVAQRGELIVMAAGSGALIDKCRPAFEAIGKSIHIIGTSAEQANVAKLAANFMISAMIETMAEAFALIRKNDIDHHKFLEIMAGEFFQSPIYQKYGKIIANEQFDSGAFTVSLQEKDTRLAVLAAIESQVPMPFATVLENTFLSAIGRGKGKLDPCAIAQIAAENAGLNT